MAWEGTFLGTHASTHKNMPNGLSLHKTIPIDGKRLPTTGILSFGFQRSDHIHNGIDIVAPEGTKIRAAASGIVKYATRKWQQGFTGYGNVVVIKNLDGTWSLYGHLRQPLVNAGDLVDSGQLIGEVGTTQYLGPDHVSHVKTGPHLHFEVSPTPYPQPNTNPRIDPIAWLKEDSSLNA